MEMQMGNQAAGAYWGVRESVGGNGFTVPQISVQHHWHNTLFSMQLRWKIQMINCTPTYQGMGGSPQRPSVCWNARYCFLIPHSVLWCGKFIMEIIFNAHTLLNLNRGELIQVRVVGFFFFSSLLMSANILPVWVPVAACPLCLPRYNGGNTWVPHGKCFMKRVSKTIRDCLLCTQMQDIISWFPVIPLAL